MRHLTRREVLLNGSAAMLAASSGISGAGQLALGSLHSRVFVASSAPDGILAYNWNLETAELTPAGVAANSVSKVAWIAFSPGNEFLYSALELDEFEGKPTGGVASFRVHQGNLEPLSERNSAATGTCHVAVDRTGRMLLSADYTGASAASFGISEGRLSEAVWKRTYTEHGPNAERQQTAHAHFASFSPNNRFAYINDLGGDRIHIYRADPATAEMTPAGEYRGAPGSGARTLHFHPNGRTAYCMNELDSTVDVLDWHKADGSLTLVKRIELLPEGYKGPTRGCDTVVTRDGRFVYFANRDNDFLYAFKADAATGALTPMRRSTCGGKTPRSFTLDPTEQWMLVANQDSNWISVIKRNPQTGELGDEAKNYPALAPMRALFV